MTSGTLVIFQWWQLYTRRKSTPCPRCRWRVWSFWNRIWSRRTLSCWSLRLVCQSEDFAGPRHAKICQVFFFGRSNVSGVKLMLDELVCLKKRAESWSIKVITGFHHSLDYRLLNTFSLHLCTYVGTLVWRGGPGRAVHGGDWPAHKRRHCGGWLPGVWLRVAMLGAGAGFPAHPRDQTLCRGRQVRIIVTT